MQGLNLRLPPCEVDLEGRGTRTYKGKTDTYRYQALPGRPARFAQVVCLVVCFGARSGGMVVPAFDQGGHPLACVTRASQSGIVLQGASLVKLASVKSPSVGLARVAGAGLGDEHDVERIIYAVPNSSCARDLVLPLLKHLAPDGAGA